MAAWDTFQTIVETAKKLGVNVTAYLRDRLSRDRGGAYAEGARQGAPQATQVADRFHLLVGTLLIPVVTG